jgi:diguanylate cyclase
MDYLKILEESKKELFNLSFGLTRKVQKQEEHIGTLNRLAYRDGLTRLRNFQSFQEAMDREMAAIERYGHTSILAMVDLDHFKAVNDAHGHAAGDQVLRSVGRFFTENIRKSDVVARYGGEEFVLILSRTPEDQGFQILERLCAQLAEMKVEYKGKKLSVTMSVGITRMSPDEPLPKSDLLWQADQALYTAKHQGRNCCSIWAQT